MFSGNTIFEELYSLEKQFILSAIKSARELLVFCLRSKIHHFKKRMRLKVKKNLFVKIRIQFQH